MSLLPALPGFGRKAIPLQGCAWLKESWPDCALKTHPDIPRDALQLFTHTEENVVSQHEGLAPHLARTYPEGTSTRKDFIAIC